jgi:hypothetical protein
MSIQIQDVEVQNVRPFPSQLYINVHGSILYPNPWVNTSVGGPITLSPHEFMSGGFVGYFSSGANVITWPSVADIANYLGMSTITGYTLDYFVANNSQQDMEFILGTDMVLRSGDSLIIPAQSAGSFRFIGYDGGWNGQDLHLHVARIS